MLCEAQRLERVSLEGVQLDRHMEVVDEAVPARRCTACFRCTAQRVPGTREGECYTCRLSSAFSTTGHKRHTIARDLPDSWGLGQQQG